MEKVHVIRLNDSVQFVIFGDFSDAQVKSEFLKSEYFKANKFNFKDWDDYQIKCRWHIDIVPFEDWTVRAI